MAFKSYLSPHELIIDDDAVARGLYVYNVVDGERKGTGWIERDLSDDPYCSFAAPFNIPLIPRSEWAARIEEMEATNTRPSDLMKAALVPCKDQKQTSYCWIFAATSCVEQVLSIQGQPFVSLSPASAGAPIKNYRNEGGWSTQGIRWIAEHGLVPSAAWPDTAIDKRWNTAETKQMRERYKVVDWIEATPRGEEQLMTLLLSRIPCACGYNREGHATICLDPLYFGGDEFGSRSRNSWGANFGDNGFFVRRGSRHIPDDIVAPHVASVS